MKKSNVHIDSMMTLNNVSNPDDIGSRSKMNKGRGCLSNLSRLFAVLSLFMLATTVTLAKNIKLTTKEQKNFIRHLFPLPQKVEVGEKAFSFLPSEFVLEIDGKLSKRSQEFIKEFKQNWAKRYKTKLATGSVGEKVTIYIGTNSKFKPFKTAKAKHLVDFSKLKTVKNAEQAYAISSSERAGKVAIYIAANQDHGIYNALTTFEQLLSVSKGQKSIVIPEVKLLDWPDIKSRGEWGSKLYKTPKRLVKYSKMKLNCYWDPFLYGSYRHGKISYQSKKELIAKGASLNIHIVPILTHLDCMMRPGYMVYENFRELMGTEGKEKFSNRRPWCFSNLKSQVVLDGILEAIARDVGSEHLWMWPSEHGYACACPKCKGDKRQQNIKEFKHIMHAYKKAKAIRGDLKMTLITTQGTRKYNLELLKYLPKDVGLDIYDGKLTYQTMTDVPILTSFEPLMKEMRAEGRSIGVVPLFAASHFPANMFFPFNSPRLSKVRMEEFKTYGIERVIGFLPPNIFVQKICGQSMAEFAWNTDGRTTKEFLISLAVRQGMNNPELFAEVILLLEPSELMLSKSIRASQIDRGVERMVDRLMGRKPKFSKYHSIRRGFMKNGKDMLSQALADCEKSCKLAEQQGSKELIYGTRLITQWIKIIALYDKYLTDKSRGKAIRNQIKELFDKMPEIWKQWIATQPLSQRRLKERRNAFYKIIGIAMKGLDGKVAVNADKIEPATEKSPKDKVATKVNGKIFEAEAADISGADISNFQSGFSGTGYVDYKNADGDYIEWKIKVDKAGDYQLLFGYALSHGNRPLRISVNGKVIQPRCSFPGTGSFTTWGETERFTAKLHAGVNTVRAEAIGSSGGNIDYLKLVQ